LVCQGERSSVQACAQPNRWGWRWSGCAGSDLGCHIDGFIATAAHSLLVQADAAAPVDGRAAEVLAAAHTALEAALRLVRPGKNIAEARARPSFPRRSPPHRSVCSVNCRLLTGIAIKTGVKRHKGGGAWAREEMFCISCLGRAVVVHVRHLATCWRRHAQNAQPL